MISYKDMTFCGNEKHDPSCDRILSIEGAKHAGELGLPVAYANFCGV